LGGEFLQHDWRRRRGFVATRWEWKAIAEDSLLEIAGMLDRAAKDWAGDFEQWQAN
jgi:hypothetical protein